MNEAAPADLTNDAGLLETQSAAVPDVAADGAGRGDLGVLGLEFFGRHPIGDIDVRIARNSSALTTFGWHELRSRPVTDGCEVRAAITRWAKGSLRVFEGCPPCLLYTSPSPR